MLEVIKENPANKTLEILIDGKVTFEAMSKLKKNIESHIQQWGEVNILERYVTFDQIEARAIWEDLRLYAQNRKNIRKVAVATDKIWIKYFTQIMSPFFRVEIKFYKNSDIAMARHWLAS